MLVRLYLLSSGSHSAATVAIQSISSYRRCQRKVLNLPVEGAIRVVDNSYCLWTHTELVCKELVCGGLPLELCRGCIYAAVDFIEKDGQHFCGIPIPLLIRLW